MKSSGEIDSPDEFDLMLQQGRALTGKPQRDLARELGIYQRYVYEMEAGEPTLSARRLRDLLRATGVRLYAEIDDGQPDD